MNAVFQSKVSAAVLCMVCLSVRATNYTCDVPEGETKSVSDFGYTFKDGDKLIKTGKGVLKAVNNTSVFYHIDISNGVYHLDSTTRQKGGATLWVRKGATLDITWTSTQLFTGDWKVYMAGDGVGTGDYLGAICVGGTGNTMNAIFGTNSEFYLSDAATVYTYGTMNPLFSGSGSTSGPTVFMNSYPLTLRGKNDEAVFRPRHKLTINKPGPIVVRNGQFTRHKTTLTCTANIPRITVTEGGSLQGFTDGDSTIWNKVDAFVFDYGTKIIKGGNGEAANPMTLANVTGPVEISSDEKVTLKGTYTARGADLAAGHVITSGTTLTFASGCKLDVTELGELEFSTGGTTYTVATSETSIVGTPTLTGDAAKLFTIANTGKALTITTKPNPGTVFLPGEENAAANTAALAAFCSDATDGMMAILSKGDYYFTGDFDLSAMTAANVTICSIDNAATIHAALKLGAAENVTVSKVNFKGTTGPAVVANGAQGLKIADCTLDGVTGTWTDGKKYPYVMDGVADLEVTGCTSVNNGENRWDDTALLTGGSQTEVSVVRAGEIVVVALKGKAPNKENVNWYFMDERMPGFNLATNTAYRGKTLVVTGDGATLDGNVNIKTLGVSSVVVKKGQYVARSDNALGVAKGPVEVKEGGSLALAGGGKSLDSRTVKFEGIGLGGEHSAIRFTGSSSWDKVQYATWNLTGDATMYDNVGNDANGNFLWAAFQMNDHTLTLTGKSGGVYRIGRSCAWYGGGEMAVKGVKLMSTTSSASLTKPSTTSFSYKDGKRPKFVFRDSATFAPESYEIQYLVTDIDFATANSQFAPGVNADAKDLPNALAFSFYRFAGAPVVGENLESLTIESNYTIHAAQLKVGKKLTLACPLTFASGSTVTLDDLSAYPKPERLLIATAEGGITGKPKPDAALVAAGWGVVKVGNSLYLDAKPGTAIIIR